MLNQKCIRGRFSTMRKFRIWKHTFFVSRTKKTDSSDNTWRHHNPTSPAPEVIRGRWTIPETPLQPLPTPSGPCTQVHPELHSSCWAPDESHVHPHSAPEQTGRASGATLQLGDRSRDHTFVCTLDLGRKGATFCKDKEASLASLTLSSGAERTTLNPLLFPVYCTHRNFSPKLTFHRV